jgi:hypothetical protein
MHSVGVCITALVTLWCVMETVEWNKKSSLVSSQWMRITKETKSNHRRLNGILDPRSVIVKATVNEVATTEDVVLMKKPKMYTFYEPTPIVWGDKRATGMTDEADAAMLALWVQEWARMGWEPVILSLNDAKRHPRYDEFHQRLREVPLHGANGNNDFNQLYNQYCYLRWLAMATLPHGGYMSDYDTLPIRRFAATIGSFTVYNTGPDGRGVPCLMSGSQTEWERLIWALLDVGLKHPDHNNWTDMLGLMELKGNYVAEKTAFEAIIIMNGQEWSPQQCAMFDGINAVHFSHNSVMHGVVKAGEDLLDRAKISERVLQGFHENCDVALHQSRRKM